MHVSPNPLMAQNSDVLTFSDPKTRKEDYQSSQGADWQLERL